MRANCWRTRSSSKTWLHAWFLHIPSNGFFFGFIAMEMRQYFSSRSAIKTRVKTKPKRKAALTAYFSQLKFGLILFQIDLKLFELPAQIHWTGCVFHKFSSSSKHEQNSKRAIVTFFRHSPKKKVIKTRRKTVDVFNNNCSFIVTSKQNSSATCYFWEISYIPSLHFRNCVSASIQWRVR